MRNRVSIRQRIGAVLNRVPAPFLVFLGGGLGALCRVHTPGGVLVANLLGSFTMGLLTVLWNAYAARDGEDRIHSFRLLFGAGMMGGYTTYSSIAAVMAQTIFLPYTVHGGYMVLAILVLLVGGLVAAASGMLTGRFVASRLVPARDVEEGR
ncbi:MAG: CrcB family protein [Rothia mucilaginosa]|uniref:fluoride efflux transporter FluC n=1 Tax=Rothia TaxID=32207 RepID=UPI0008A50DF7|nr:MULTISPECIES: CrcB family protein [Rothia]MBS5101233.1 CrcB family protein [Rothia mucilaginosa]OFR61315.1 camphor resistance protein CrcB [Rothia sp. HMSC069C04]